MDLLGIFPICFFFSRHRYYSTFQIEILVTMFCFADNELSEKYFFKYYYLYRLEKLIHRMRA